MRLNDADRMANSVEPDQTAHRFWVYTVCSDLSCQIFRNITVIMMFRSSWNRGPRHFILGEQEIRHYPMGGFNTSKINTSKFFVYRAFNKTKVQFSSLEKL